MSTNLDQLTADAGSLVLMDCDPGVARFALTPGYFISRPQRENLSPPLRSGLCPELSATASLRVQNALLAP